MPRNVDLNEVRAIITEAGGTLEQVINWEWCKFEDDVTGSAVFEKVCRMYPDLDHRGYSKAQPESSNTNLRLGGFRFR